MKDNESLLSNLWKKLELKEQRFGLLHLLFFFKHFGKKKWINIYYWLLSFEVDFEVNFEVNFLKTYKKPIVNSIFWSLNTEFSNLL